MWVHPDLVEGQQWTTITSRKSRGKQKLHLAMWCVLPPGKQKIDIPSLTDSEEEETIVLAAELNAPLVARTRLGQSYSKKYDEMVASPSKLTQEPTNQSTKQLVEKQKEYRYAKTLPKNERSSAPYRFDVLAQLANIPARITFTSS